MGEKKLYVNLLGEFSVWYGDKKVYMERTSTGRQAQLFQLLMISPGFQISKEKLMADIYKSESSITGTTVSTMRSIV